MSFRFTIKLADVPIDVSCLYESTLAYCKKYLSEEAAELSVVVTADDISQERQRETEPDKWSDQYLETLALYRKIANVLLDKQVLLFHGSAVAVDGHGYLFTGPSGAGKSTHVRLWRELFDSCSEHEMFMINDDKPLMRFFEDDLRVYGTPWDGKHRLSNNSSVPLKAIGLIQAAENNSVHELDPADKWPLMLRQCYQPETHDGMEKTLVLLGNLSERVDFYRVNCNMNLEAARVAYETMSHILV